MTTTLDTNRQKILEDLRQRYRRVSRWASFHMRGRFGTCPMDAIEQSLPSEGWIASLGCGNGAFETYAALCNPARRILGADPNSKRIAEARLASEGLDILFEDKDFFDALKHHEIEPRTILINDVLALIPRAQHEDIVKRFFDVLSPGGILHLKDMDLRPRRKYYWNFFQEILACRVLRFTHSNDGFNQIRSADDWCELLKRTGFVDIEVRKLDKGYLHPHLLLVATKPGPTPRG